MTGRQCTMLILASAFLIAIIISGCGKNRSLTYDVHLTLVNTNDTLFSYIGKKPHAAAGKKLLVILQGSEQSSVRRFFGYGAEASVFGYDLLLINKFAYNDPERYWRTNCLDRRIEDVVAVINDVADNVYKDSLRNIMLFGGSEGGSIAPIIAKRIPKITHLIIAGSSCLSQGKELEILESKGFKHENNFLRASGIMNLDELQQKIAEITASTDTLRGWMGYSYKYWKSTLNDTMAYTALSELTIPVLILSGMNDESVPVESVQLLKDSLGSRNNITFAFIDNANHELSDVTGHSLMPKIYRDIIYPWGKKTGAL